MKLIGFFLLIKLICAGKLEDSTPPPTKNNNDISNHSTSLNTKNSGYKTLEIVEDDFLILSKAPNFNNTVTLSNTEKSTLKVKEPQNKGKLVVNSYELSSTIPLSSGRIDLSLDKKKSESKDLEFNKKGSHAGYKGKQKEIISGNKSKKEIRKAKLNELIDKELLSKTNLKGDTLSHKLSNLLITKLTDNLEHFSKNPNQLVKQLETLRKEKLPKEYKSKLLSELDRYSTELTVLESSDKFKDKENKNQNQSSEEEEGTLTEAKGDLNSRFAEVLVPILIPLLKPLLENIIIRVTSKDFYLDIKDFFQNLFKIKSDPGWTFWKGLKRIFFGKTDEELEEYRKKELDKVFGTLTGALNKGLEKSIEYIAKDQKGDKKEEKKTTTEKDKSKEKKTESPSGPFKVPEITESTKEKLDKREKGKNVENEQYPEIEGELDFDDMFPLPDPLTPEEQEAKNKAQALLSEGKVKEYKELITRLNDYYQEKLKHKSGDPNKPQKDDEEGKKKLYYPKLPVAPKKEESGFRTASIVLTLLLTSIYAF